MKPIRPIRVVRSAKDKVVSSKSPSPISDTPDARSGYDPRLMGETPLAEEYKHYPLMSFFNLSMEERQDTKINDQIKAIHKWVTRRFPQADRQGLYRSLRMLEQEIGMPQIGDTRLNNMYGYVSIENQIDELESERENRYGY